MKKITILAVLFIAFKSQLHSQITKGNWLLGGNISFSDNKITSDLGTELKTTTIQVAGNAGYFLADKLVAGLRPNLFFERTESNDTDLWSNRSNIGPFLRYYFLPDDQRVNLFVDGAYAYGQTKVTGSKAIASHSYAFAAGPVVFLNTSVALELSLGYSKTNHNDAYNSKRSHLQSIIGLQFHLEKE